MLTAQWVLGKLSLFPEHECAWFLTGLAVSTATGYVMVAGPAGCAHTTAVGSGRSEICVTPTFT
jgi:hypothetical protein